VVALRAGLAHRASARRTFAGGATGGRWPIYDNVYRPEPLVGGSTSESHYLVFTGKTAVFDCH
jgi:hypothetical protein